MLLIRATISSILIFSIVISEMIVQQTIICDTEEFFDKFLINHQLKCINIHEHDTVNVISDEISKCLWNYFEEKIRIPVYRAYGSPNLLCDNHILLDASNTTFEENDFAPFSQMLLINTDLEYLNLYHMFLHSLNVFSIKIDLNENHLSVFPEFVRLIDNKTFDWTKSNKYFLNKYKFIEVLLLLETQNLVDHLVSILRDQRTVVAR